MLVNNRFWKSFIIIIFMINELHLLCVAYFIPLGIYFFLGTKFFWNEETDICFNVECVLHGRNFDFLGGYLIIIARYLMVTTGYCSLPGDYCSLLVVTARYRSFPLEHERLFGALLMYIDLTVLNKCFICSRKSFINYFNWKAG